MEKQVIYLAARETVGSTSEIGLCSTVDVAKDLVQREFHQFEPDLEWEFDHGTGEWTCRYNSNTRYTINVRYLIVE